VFYETTVIRKRIGGFLAYCTRWTNEGEYAEAGLKYFINAMGRRTLINAQSFVLKAKRCFTYFH